MVAKQKKQASSLREMHRILADRLDKEGWPNVKQFHDRSGVSSSWSHETTRRVFVEHPKRPEALTVAIVCRYLGMSRKAISDLLREHMADAPNANDLIWLIGDGTEDSLTITEKATLDAIKKIVEAKPELSANIADQLDLLAAAAGVDVHDLTQRLRRRK